MKTVQSQDAMMNKCIIKVLATLCFMLFILVSCKPSVNTVQQTTDQTKLAKIAVEAKDTDVRKAALNKLTDQALLAKIAVEDEDADVCSAAVEKLTDQALLAKIAMEAKWSTVLSAAMDKLTDQAMLAKITVEAEDWKMRKAALERVTDQALLAKIAVEAEDFNVRSDALEKVTDQALLAKIAVEAGSLVIRKGAKEKLTDQAFLAKIAVEAENLEVRKLAVEKLTDQALLAKIAVEDKEEDVREAAVEKLTDKVLLAKIGRLRQNIKITGVISNLKEADKYLFIDKNRSSLILIDIQGKTSVGLSLVGSFIFAEGQVAEIQSNGVFNFQIESLKASKYSIYVQPIHGFTIHGGIAASILIDEKKKEPFVIEISQDLNKPVNINLGKVLIKIP
jgi:hypothetical protein